MPLSASSVLTAAAILLLICVAEPASRLPRSGEFRRIFPAASAMVVVMILGWWTLIAIVAARVPELLVPAAAITALGWTAMAWRARPSYGHPRGLPPGSLSLVASVRGIADRTFYARQAMRYGPVFKTSQVSGNVVCIVGLERSQRLFHAHGQAIGASPLPFHRQIPGGFLRYMSDADHDLYGGLFRKALSRPTVEAGEPGVRAIVRRELASLAEQVRARGSGVDPVPLLTRVARDSILGVMFGYEPGSRRYERFRSVHARLDSLTTERSMNADERRATEELIAWVLADSRTAGDDADSGTTASVLSQLNRLDPRMPDETAIANMIFMVQIGADNLAGFLHWILVMLTENPEWKERLRTEPAVADAFVSETLRLAQSEYLYRRLEQDVEFEGFRLPRGWRVRVCVAESHRDPAIFERPEQFTDRFVDRHYRPSEFQPFGTGRHACNGVGIVSLVARVFLDELLAGPGFELTGYAAPIRHMRHWSHWRPGPSPRICVPASGADETPGCPMTARPR